MPNVKLQSSDGETFVVDVLVAGYSKKIKSMMEELGVLDLGHEETIFLPNVNAAILTKIIQWSTYHKNNPIPAKHDEDENMAETTDIDISVWDADFLKVDTSTLLKLCSAAHYLDINGLFNLTCKVVANIIKGRTVEEIREVFHIENDRMT